MDKNLDKVCGIIEERVRNQIEYAKKGICEKVESLKARLNDSVVCYERMREGLIKAGRAYGTYPITSKQESHNE
ncbi:hypothetical protein MPF95_03630 [Helicobacter pylori]|nr:hypothetical protein [Helicobacter pylori]UOS26368.1 hypothetical protein MPF95_03630 [Helicobacter pylori]